MDSLIQSQLRQNQLDRKNKSHQRSLLRIGSLTPSQEFWSNFLDKFYTKMPLWLLLGYFYEGRGYKIEIKKSIKRIFVLESPKGVFYERGRFVISENMLVRPILPTTITRKFPKSNRGFSPITEVISLLLKRSERTFKISHQYQKLREEIIKIFADHKNKYYLNDTSAFVANYANLQEEYVIFLDASTDKGDSVQDGILFTINKNSLLFIVEDVKFDLKLQTIIEKNESRYPTTLKEFENWLDRELSLKINSYKLKQNLKKHMIINGNCKGNNNYKKVGVLMMNLLTHEEELEYLNTVEKAKNRIDAIFFNKNVKHKKKPLILISKEGKIFDLANYTSILSLENFLEKLSICPEIDTVDINDLNDPHFFKTTS